MKKIILVCFCLAVLIAPAVVFAQVPQSVRSKEAIKRVKPHLTQELQENGFQYGSPVFIRIFKQSNALEVWVKKGKNFELFNNYWICTYGFRGLGPKEKQGDGKAPEGFYSIYPKSLNPSSNYHLAFNLGYPNEYDRAHKRTGSALMIHGDCVSIGCYAMTDKTIEELYALADGAFRNGQKAISVHIFPFRMTEEHMNRYADSKNINFWRNLKEGHDYFEKAKNPPRVSVINKKYTFN
ncbi:MAG: murein L,D-transpeptidase [Syntrophaceae bacterium]|nr:murein L,D-transpeptidase [Syntrophaceae bacterium]